MNNLFIETEKKKENALIDYIQMTKRSWTYNKMFENEKKTVIAVLSNFATKDALKGSYRHRWNILNAVYRAYLVGIGYNDFKWRE